MYKYILSITFLFTYLFAEYNVGDQIDEDDLKETFDYCYPGDSTSYTFSFSKNCGKIFMLEFSASW